MDSSFYSVVALFRMVCWSSLALGIVGCGGENKTPKNIPVVHMQASTCFSGTLSKISGYFSGVATERETTEVWSCFSNIVSEFNTYVRGQSNQRYTADELRNFLEYYFLSEYSPSAGERHLISDEFLNEIMVMKQLFFGGSTETFTHAELKEVLVFFEEMRVFTVDFLPHSRIFLTDNQSLQPTETQIVAAADAVAHIVEKIFLRFAAKNERYELSHLARLLRESHVFFVALKGETRFKSVDQFVPLLGQFKYLILNTDATAVVRSDYAAGPRLCRIFADIYLRTKFYIKKSSFYDAPALQQIQRAVNLFADVVSEGIHSRGEQPIPTEGFEQFIVTAGEAGIMPVGVQVADLQSILRLVIDSILTREVTFGDSALAASITPGLTVDKLRYIERQVVDFLNVQKMFIENRGDDSQAGWREMQQLLSGPWSLSLDHERRLIFSGERGSTNIEGFTQLNWMRKLTKPILRFYIQDPERQGDRLEIALEEIGHAIEDVRPLLVGLGIINVDDTGFYKSVFREANLFMPRSDGNEYLSYTEFTEYLHHVIAGMNASDYFISLLPPDCMNAEGKTDGACFRNQFIELKEKTLSHMPHYLQHANSLTPQAWQQDLDLIEGLARNVTSFGEPFLKSEVMRAFISIQYLESLMLRFDQDRTATLDIGESLLAFPHFHRTLADILGSDFGNAEDRQYLESFFTFLLSEGSYPGDGVVDTDVRFLDWRWHRETWQLNATRGSLLQILSKLNQLGRQ